MDSATLCKSAQESYLEASKPLADLARSYLAALLRGERHWASQSILRAVADGTSVKKIYLHVFQPVQYEVGRLWQTQQISVAQEHYCTAATQLIMSQMYPQIHGSDQHEQTMVATCVSGDLHEIGVRMVADFFEMDGWTTVYLGANTPHDAVVEIVADRKAVVLGVSATMPSHLDEVKELIETVRATDACRHVRVLVGGAPFNATSELWRQLGADGCATDAQSALNVANRWVGRRPSAI